MSAASWKSNRHKPVIVVIGLLLLAYVPATLLGWTDFEPAAGHDAEEGARGVAEYWAILPFTLLLGSIAVLPLLEQTAHWWEHNLNKFYVAVNLALITLVYLALFAPGRQPGPCRPTPWST